MRCYMEDTVFDIENSCPLKKPTVAQIDEE